MPDHHKTIQWVGDRCRPREVDLIDCHKEQVPIVCINSMLDQTRSTHQMTVLTDRILNKFVRSLLDSIMTEMICAVVLAYQTIHNRSL